MTSTRTSIDVELGSLPPVRVVAGPAFELIAQLSAFTSGPARPSLDSGKSWIREVRELAGQALIEGVERWSLGLYGELASVALEAGPPFRTEQLVRQLRAMRPVFLWQRLLGAESPPNRAMVSSGAFDRAIAGDASARAELIEVLGVSASARQAIERLLATRPEFVQAEIAAIVETWAERVFRSTAAVTSELIARDVEAKEQLFAKHRPADAIRIITNGVEFGPLPWATEIVVIPTVALRPFIAPVEWRSTIIILCPVGDEAFDDDPAAPPRRVVKVAAALGDALRLRIVRELGDGGVTASELAEAIGVDRTSLHHHLGILRSAGLVAIRAEGIHHWIYAVNEDGLSRANEALFRYLQPPRD